MAKTIEQLKAQGAEIKNATVVGENTATRVGTLFNDIVEHVEDYEAKQAQRDTKQDNDTASLVSAEAEARSLAISQEAQTRAKNDENLNKAIVAEKDRATAEETRIDNVLAAETARAKAAEQANATSIIGTNRIADGAVTTEKLADSAIDDEPTVGSDNMVKSGGVFNQCYELLRQTTIDTYGYYPRWSIKDYAGFRLCFKIKRSVLKEGAVFRVVFTSAAPSYDTIGVIFNNVNKTNYQHVVVDVPSDAEYITIEDSSNTGASYDLEMFILNTDATKVYTKGLIDENNDQLFKYEDETPLISASVIASTSIEYTDWKYVFTKHLMHKDCRYVLLLTTTIAPTRNFDVVIGDPEQTISSFLAGQTKQLIAFTPANDSTYLRLLLNKQDNNGATWTAKIYSLDELVHNIFVLDAHKNKYIDDSSLFKKLLDESFVSTNDYYKRYSVKLLNGCKYKLSITTDLVQSQEVSVYITNSKIYPTEQYIASLGQNEKTILVDIEVPLDGIYEIQIRGTINDNSNWSVKVYEANWSFVSRNLDNDFCGEADIPVISSLAKINALTPIENVFTLYANSIQLTDKTLNYLVNFNAAGDLLNHVPIISVIDNNLWTLVDFNKISNKEVANQLGVRVRKQNMTDVFAHDYESYTDYILADPEDYSKKYIYNANHEPIEASARQGQVIDVNGTIKVPTSAYSFDNDAVTEVYIAVSDYDSVNDVFSSFNICNFIYDGGTYEFNISNINEVFNINKKNYSLAFTNFVKYGDYWYTCIGGYEGISGIVFKTSDMVNFEYVFTTIGNKLHNEFSIAIYNGQVYIASRRIPYAQECYLQKYTLQGELLESVLVHDAIPTTENTVIARPVLFTFGNKLYLCVNWPNRNQASFILVDSYSIKNLRTVAEKLNTYWGFNNFSFDTYEGKLLCAATYTEAYYEGAPMTAVCNLGTTLEPSTKDDVRNKFRTLFLN